MAKKENRAVIAFKIYYILLLTLNIRRQYQKIGETVQNIGED